MPDPAAPDTPPGRPPFTELGLPVPLVQALRREGITDTFPIQAATIPDALAGRDVLGRAPTGSGKTLAFGLPLLARLANAPAIPRRPRGLILAPTRELAMQIERALEPFATALGLRSGTAVGGIPAARQADRLLRGLDLLVATPGRLADLVDRGTAALDEVRVTAVDEADHMAEFGFLPQIRRLLDLTRTDGQRLLFSATLDQDVQALVDRYLRDPVTHTAEAQPTAAPPATHHLLYVRAEDKLAVVARIAARPGRTLLFVRTQYGAERLTRRLRDTGIAAAALHGGKIQRKRTRTLDSFADGSVNVLVATDIAARGIHVDDISLVVHVDPPTDPKDYLHRAGRTARAGAAGTVVTLVTPEQRAEVAELTRSAGMPVEQHEIRPDDRELRRLTGARTPPGTASRGSRSAPVRAADTPGRPHRHTGRTAPPRRIRKRPAT